MIRKEDSEIIRKVPLLGDIPLVGALFRYRENPAEDNVKRELLVFLTPRIIRDGSGEMAKVILISSCVAGIVVYLLMYKVKGLK